MENKILPPLPSSAFGNVRVMLASNSPRRRELLGLVVPEFSIAEPREVDEVYPADLPAEQVPEYLAHLKASAYMADLPEDVLLITADTVVILDGEILGKPRNAEHAKAMLAKLAGRTHTVVTGVCLSTRRHCRSFSTHTDVTFGPLSEQEISTYVDRFRPLDKAGAYGIQEWIGAAAIQGMVGSFYNVMGLPLHALYNELKVFPLEG